MKGENAGKVVDVLKSRALSRENKYKRLLAHHSPHPPPYHYNFIFVILKELRHSAIDTNAERVREECVAGGLMRRVGSRFVYINDFFLSATLSHSLSLPHSLFLNFRVYTLQRYTNG